MVLLVVALAVALLVDEAALLAVEVTVSKKCLDTK